MLWSSGRRDGYSVSRGSIEAAAALQSCSEIYQVTGPVERFAGQIASQGYVVGEKYCAQVMNRWLAHYFQLACPSVYHEFEGPEPIPYDTEGKIFLSI